ncbi:hypothetical protein X760_30345 [Mesorhizobium sp. LSHC422A00]|nr:hypothetical protein X760_30345 [Mesorhizobium sp. LSHC422A00]
MAEPARFRRIVVAQIRQVAIKPGILEIDVATLAGAEESFAHRPGQSLLGGDLMTGAQVGQLVAAPCPCNLGRVLGAQALGGEMVDEEQPVLVGQVRRQAFRVESNVHGSPRQEISTRFRFRLCRRADADPSFVTRGRRVPCDGFLTGDHSLSSSV